MRGFYGSVFALRLMVVIAALQCFSLPISANQPSSTEERPTKKINADILFWLQSHRHQQSEYTKLIEQANKSISANPNNPDGYLLRGLSEWRLTRSKEAIADLSTAMKLSHKPLPAHVYIARGESYRELGDMQKSLADFDVGVKLYPEVAICLTRRAESYCQTKEFDKALADATKLTKLEPDMVYHYELRGRIYTSLGHFDKAAADFTTAIKKREKTDPYDPILAQDYSNRARNYDKLGKHQLAAKDQAMCDRLVRDQSLP
jgi:tetratricopeptide (TPR) repeat protein